MSDTNDEQPDESDEPTRREDARAELQAFAATLKEEFGIRLDQKLDELGARLGGS